MLFLLLNRFTRDAGSTNSAVKSTGLTKTLRTCLYDIIIKLEKLKENVQHVAFVVVFHFQLTLTKLK